MSLAVETIGRRCSTFRPVVTPDRQIFPSACIAEQAGRMRFRVADRNDLAGLGASEDGKDESLARTVLPILAIPVAAVVVALAITPRR